MPRVLITGAAGFTGRYLTELLNSQDYEVHGLVHKRDLGIVPGAHAIHVADLADLAAVKAVVDRVQPDHAVHLAAISFVGHADIGQMYRANVVGSRQLLEALVSRSKSLRSVILAGSANVYGNGREGIIDETATLVPVNDYGVTKVAMEFVASTYAGRLPLILTRPFNYTGRGQSSNFLIPKIVAHARDRKPLIELGNLDVARDFSDVRTVVDAYARLMTNASAIGGTFNVSSGRATSLGDVLELVCELSGHSFQVQVNPSFVRANEVRSLCGSAAKLENAIGPLKAIALMETLQWMLEG